MTLPYTSPIDRQDREYLEELLALEEGLSDWEVGFLENLKKWRGSYTMKQREILHKIWTKMLRDKNTHN